MSALTKAGQILAPWLQQSGLRHYIIERQIQARWAAVAGHLVASHSRPQRLRHRRLTVAVESPAWLHQLSYLQPMLMEQLRRAFGDGPVAELRFVVGPLDPPEGHVQEAAGQGEQSIQSTPLSPERQAIIDAAIAPLHDPDMALVVKRLMAKALSRRATQ